MPEREVTGERIRDKIAASKRKGLWMGGNLPLGYDANGRTLAVNEVEAEQVRHIFRRYLELKSVHRLKDELEQQGFPSKVRVTPAGKARGGAVMNRGAIFHLLSNRTYLGEIPHKQESFPGQHQAIVDRGVFDTVQTALDANRRRRAEPSQRTRASPLAGKIFDETGAPMSPAVARGKGGKRYRYYVSAPLQQGARADPDGTVRRLAAATLEAHILNSLRRISGTGTACTWTLVAEVLERMDVRRQDLVLHLCHQALCLQGEGSAQALRLVSDRLVEGERAWLAGDQLMLALSVRPILRGGRTRMAGSVHRHAHLEARPDRALIAALRKAHAMLKAANLAPTQSPDDLLLYKALEDTHERKLARLAFLAPSIQQALLDGLYPPGLTLQDLISHEIPADWSEQRRNFGFEPTRARVS